MKTNIKRAKILGICLLFIVIFCTFETVSYADETTLDCELTQIQSPDEIPPICSESEWDSRGYITGFITGQNLIKMAWAKINNCDLIERFESIVMNIVYSLQLPPDASLYSSCRYAGYQNGIMDIIELLYRCCEEKCYNDGEIIGKIVATMYCELSIALDGLFTADEFVRAPVQLCGFNFEFACDITFLFETMSYPDGLGLCYQYTVEPYFEVWNQVRNNSCAYKIPGVIDLAVPPDPSE